MELAVGVATLALDRSMDMSYKHPHKGCIDGQDGRLFVSVTRAPDKHVVATCQ